MPKEPTIREIELEFEYLKIPVPAIAGEYSLLEELADPGAMMTFGDMARAGALFLAVGKMLDTASRQCVMGGGTFQESGVRFSWRNPTTKVDEDQFREIYPPSDHPHFYKPPAVETAAVRKEFPEATNPGLYRPDRKGHVVVELP